MSKLNLFKTVKNSTNKNVRNFSAEAAPDQNQLEGGIVFGNDDFYVVVSW
ncbi:hypothetical protein HDE68_000351 [Pedobacter cryoconitis]|uniref:Uncharacterized protein n=1 Tax=Pedobacter cryoconitis TaxID=188932 RepID=A0A7W8ZIA7_9SPHI|nr:hypothetical protein [Pedobacter cryoconitis]MBB5634466.1 hypothetical protein [Pedobacter cryoconitis]